MLHPGSPLAAHALSTLHESDKGALVHAAAELARFDSRKWIGTLGLTRREHRDHPAITWCPASAQLELARLLEVPDDRIVRMAHGHMACLDHSFGVLVDTAAFSVT